MKINSIISLIFVVISLATLGYSIPDSDGTEFITSFLYKDAQKPSNFSLSLYFLLSAQYSGNINVKYYSLKSKKIKTIKVIPKYGKTNELSFDYNDVISEDHPSSGNAWDVIDPRIFINSSTPIKVIARLYNKLNNQGDMYIVPPVSFAGTTYLVKLPKTVLGNLQLLHIMSLQNQEVNVEIITTTISSNKTTSQNFTIDGTPGSPQKVVSCIVAELGKSYYIKASKPVLITAAVNGADLNAYMSNSNTTIITYSDYVAYMPQPIGEWNMKTMLTPKDRRVTFGENTVALDISPSDVKGYNKLPIVTYTNINTTNGTSDLIQIHQVEEYRFDHNKITEFATSSSHAVAVLTRIGSPGATTNQTLNGMYIHYIPESTQFYNGITQFITLNNGDYYEVYVENLKNNYSLTLNGQSIPINAETTRQLDFFNRTYTVFKITVPKAGVNTFNCTLNYIGYVISKINNNWKTAYGYLTGFNKSKLQTYWNADETTTTNVYTVETTTIGGNTLYTTTKSTSKIDLYSPTVILLFILLSFTFY